VREVMCELLRARGNHVFSAGSPIGVTKLIVQQQIDVVVLDVMMPQMSGDKLAALLRANPKLRQLAIVLVSSCKVEELARLAKEVTADSTVTKAEIYQRLADVTLAAYQHRMLLRTRKQADG